MKIWKVLISQEDLRSVKFLLKWDSSHWTFLEDPSFSLSLVTPKFCSQSVCYVPNDLSKSIKDNSVHLHLSQIFWHYENMGLVNHLILFSINIWKCRYKLPYQVQVFLFLVCLLQWFQCFVFKIRLGNQLELLVLLVIFIVLHV